MSRLALLVLGCSVFGCDLRSPSLEEAPPATSRAPRAEPAPDPAPDPAPVDPAPTPPDLSLGDGFELRGAIRDGRLALMPIVATGPIAPRAYGTLHESMQRRTATVREADGGFEIERVWVTNHASQPLLVLNGEVLIDAHQDRVLAETAVIPPHEGRELRVRCVEASRSEGGQQFRSGGAIAELSLRRVVAHQDQTLVWAKVDQINDRRGLAPDTHTYRHAAAQHARGPIAAARDRLLAQLASHPDRSRMVGVAVAVGGRVLAVDQFATPDLYRRLEPRLLASYAASEEDAPREGRRVTPDDIRALMSSSRSVTEASRGALAPPE